MSLVGDGWTLLVLRELFYGESRFDGLVTTLGIARSTLTERLRTLTDNGIVARVAYQQDPIRHDYQLTEKGQDLFGVIAAINTWGNRWMSDARGIPIVLHHKTCDHDFDAAIVCRACRQEIRREDITVRVGPGYPDHLKTSPAFTRRFTEGQEN
ncbi:winged helix-turn-helix transcriptional regulator [Rhodococcus qingshengii]|uniref:winged helix-turn-helix transcriptional regulator n=1 Tax=Rhodococcus qingshengii TaxID=334542 RepID=UPI0031589F17